MLSLWALLDSNQGPTDYEVESIIFIQSQGGLVRHI